MKKKTKKAKPKAKAKKTKRVVRRPAKAAARRSSPKKTKKSVKKAKARKKKTPAAPKMSIIPPVNGVLLGRVEDYFAHIQVIALTLQKPIRLGERLHVLGHTTNIEQPLDSIQINHQAVTEANPKDPVGIKVNGRARRGDYVFIIRE